ncbi:MAG: citrate synthase, partial [Dysgonamonadaceae bacterium]|nr:citrate synthase [Dysgonamonadaceae bacterium]
AFELFTYLKATIGNWRDIEEIDRLLIDVLNGRAFDQSGLIYGIGHSVYTRSDPRAVILRDLADHLARQKGRQDEFDFWELVGRRAVVLIKNRHGKQHIVSPNIDFYSCIVYEMLGLPKDIFVALFAMSRIVGWCAHYMEEVTKRKKIIRPKLQKEPT